MIVHIRHAEFKVARHDAAVSNESEIGLMVAGRQRRRLCGGDSRPYSRANRRPFSSIDVEFVCV